MTVYFVTRFSIFDPSFRGFRLSTDHDVVEYERRLFDRGRLDHKFATFESITLRSVVAQTRTDWRWIIYASDRLPSNFAARLIRLVTPYPQITVRAVPSFREFFGETQSYDYGESFATVRLDDDDGVGSAFVENLQQYSASRGTIICFTEGRLVKYSDDKVVRGEAVSERNNAQGLTAVGLNIYNCGRHSDIDSRYPVVYDSTAEMYLLCCSPYADTQRGFTSLDRAAAKVRRLVFLVGHRPTEARDEVFNFFARRMKRVWKRPWGA